MFSERGQTLMELIVVTSVSVIIIGALVFATISSLRNAQFSKNQSQATKLAQEGIERVRSARDRNDPITIGGSSVTSWNGDTSGTGVIWGYQIYSGCGSGVSGTACYLKFISSSNGALNWFSSSSTFPASGTEEINNSAFKRVVILSDDATTYTSQKTVTVIVRWTDFSGPHESRLTTILRKL